MSYSRFGFACLGIWLSCHPVAAQTMAEATACLARLYNSPETASLRPHVPLNPINATAAQLSDPSYPTPPEIAAIRAIYPHFLECQHQAVAALAETLPGLVPVRERLHAVSQEDLRLLLERRLSWGAWLTHYRDRALILQAEAQRLPEYRAALAAQAQRQQQAAQQALLREQAELLNQQRQAIAQQQLLNAANTFSQMGQPSRLPYGAYTLPSSGLSCTYGGGYMQCH
jgi:hypothetical protein